MANKTIYAAAIIVTLLDGRETTIPCHRHGDAYEILGALGVERKKHLDKQGFLVSEVDDNDRFNTKYYFVNRVEGKKIALENGQFKGEDRYYDELFSEDLW